MKGLEEITPLVVAVLVAIVLFIGIVTAITKSMGSSPKQDTIDSALQIKEQKRRMEDIQRRQKQLMRDQRQKIRDLQRR
ncbi:MAG: hypothetical protein KAJ70_04270 [Candidatus Omnitrophica bacterium]|nr:hypothetical protein [Candidatus Omnitrophota bacterium]